MRLKTCGCCSACKRRCSVQRALHLTPTHRAVGRMEQLLNKACLTSARRRSSSPNSQNPLPPPADAQNFPPEETTTGGGLGGGGLEPPAELARTEQPSSPGNARCQLNSERVSPELGRRSKTARFLEPKPEPGPPEQFAVTEPMPGATRTRFVQVVAGRGPGWAAGAPSRPLAPLPRKPSRSAGAGPGPARN